MHSLFPVPLMCVGVCTLVSTMGKKDHSCSQLFMSNDSALGFFQERKKTHLHLGKYLLVLWLPYHKAMLVGWWKISFLRSFKKK